MSSEMRELIRKEVEQWVGITRNRDIERSARVWMEGYDAALTYCAERISALLARTEAGAVEKRAPVQRYHGKTIPWRVHGLAWEAYAKKYGSSQSAERIAERGGFGVGEMDEFLPGWREMAEDTHPQDASGDAERTKALLLALIQIRDSTYRNATQLRGMANDALERDRTRPVTAMQAKEAK